MSDSVMFGGRRRSTQAIANHRAYQRARERARSAMRGSFPAEFADLCPPGHRGRGALRAAALRELARRHPRVFRRHMSAELTKEHRVPLPLGRPPVSGKSQ